MLEVPLPLLHTWPVDMQLPWTLVDALSTVSSWPSHLAPEEICFYTDGSKNTSRQVGSAVVLFVRHRDTWYLGGILAARASGEEAIHGEHNAMLLALVWTIQLLQQHPTIAQATYHFDAMVTGCQTVGQWQGHKHPIWWKALRSLQQITQMFPTQSMAPCVCTPRYFWQ